MLTDQPVIGSWAVPPPLPLSSPFISPETESEIYRLKGGMIGHRHHAGHDGRISRVVPDHGDAVEPSLPISRSRLPVKSPWATNSRPTCPKPCWVSS
jgi:hypothetical protein